MIIEVVSIKENEVFSRIFFFVIQIKSTDVFFYSNETSQLNVFMLKNVSVYIHAGIKNSVLSERKYYFSCKASIPPGAHNCQRCPVSHS